MIVQLVDGLKLQRQRLCIDTKPEDTTLNPEPDESFGIIIESASESVSIAIR